MDSILSPELRATEVLRFRFIKFIYNIVRKLYSTKHRHNIKRYENTFRYLENKKDVINFVFSFSS